MTIRLETAQDIDAIYALNEAAFGEKEVPEIVDNLRRNGNLVLSFVVEVDGRVVGHVGFSPARLTLPTRTVAVLGCGPVGILPEYQRQGIGSQMMREVLAACADAGHELVFLLGHPWFYPRFGFRPAKPLGVRWEGDTGNGMSEPFMVKELREGALAEALASRQAGDALAVFKFSPEFPNH